MRWDLSVILDSKRNKQSNKQVITKLHYDFVFTLFLRLESKITERSHLMKYRRPMVDGYRNVPHQPRSAIKENVYKEDMGETGCIMSARGSTQNTAKHIKENHPSQNTYERTNTPTVPVRTHTKQQTNKQTPQQWQTNNPTQHTSQEHKQY